MAAAVGFDVTLTGAPAVISRFCFYTDRWLGVD